MLKKVGQTIELADVTEEFNARDEFITIVTLKNHKSSPKMLQTNQGSMVTAGISTIVTVFCRDMSFHLIAWIFNVVPFNSLRSPRR
jgi:hypothetical protein